MADAAARFGPDAPDGFQELAQAGAAEPVGHVDTVNGDAFITRVDGTRVAAHEGTEIFQGDTIDTGPHGAIGVVFIDDSTFALSESGHMTIDQMVYDPASQQGTSVVGITEGVFTFVSGEIAKTQVDAMQIQTALGTIGIRGTSGGGRLLPTPDGGPPSGTFSLFQDPGGPTGEMYISTTSGTVVLNQPNATTQIANPFLPPSPPVVLPAQAVQAAYAAAARTMPASARAARDAQANGGNQGNNGGDQGNNGQGNDQGNAQGGGDGGQNGDGNAGNGGPGNDAAPADGTPLAAGEQAAAAAFGATLAQGGSIDDAIAAAVQTAGETEARFGVDPTLTNQLTTQDVTQAALDSLVQQSLGAVGVAAVGPTAGPGGGVGGTGDSGTGGSGTTGGGDTQANGDPAAGGDVLAAFLQATAPISPPPPPPPITTTTITQPLQTTNTDTNTTSTFAQTLNGTTGNDNIVGNDGNTEVIMQQGASLGGNDTVSGNGGTDEIAFSHLSDMQMVWNIAASTITYSNNGGSVAGTVALSSVEQIYADDGSESSTRLTLDLASGNAYILAGTTGNDILDASNGTPLSYLGTSVSSVAGVLIFGNAGNDTITGSGVGDVIFTGLGNDNVTAGTGDDVIFTPATDLNFSDVIDGGGGLDELHLTGGGTVTDLAFSSVLNVENIGLDAHAYDITLDYNASSAFNGAVNVYGYDLGANSLTLNAVNFGAGNLTVDLAGTTGAHDVTLTTGTNIFYGGSGVDTVTIGASTLTSDDVINGGGGTDVLNLAGGGTLTDLAFASISSIEHMVLDANVYDITLGTNAANAFPGLTLDATGVGANALTLDASGYGGGLFNINVDLTGSSGANNITGSLAGDSITGGSGNDTINSGGGHDTVDISNGGDDTVITGVNGADIIAGAALTGADTITGTAGVSDELHLDGNYATNVDMSNVTNIDEITLTDGNSYFLTFGNTTGDSTNGLTVDGSALTGTNVLTLHGFTNNSVMTVTGGAGDDQISGGFGHDVLTGGNGSDTFLYTDAAEGGDTITDFTAGFGGDVIKATGLLSSGLGSTFGSGTLSDAITGTGTHVVTQAFANYDTASNVQSALASVTGAANTRTLLVTTDGTDSQVWQWDDSTGANASDGHVQAGELTAIAHLNGVDAANLTTDNFTSSGGIA